MQINYGIKTGCNEAFIISTEKRNEILSTCQDEAERSRTAALIRPILRGRDIKRYGYEWKDLWLIWIPWHFPYHLDPSIQGASIVAEEAFKEQYPAVYQHLLQYKDVLSKRNQAETGIRYEWYALQRWGAKYWEDFLKPKIVWGEISDRSKFSYEEEGIYIPEATTFLMTGPHLPYLLCALNSPISEWFFSKVGTTTGVGTVRWKKFTIEELLVPRVETETLGEFDNLLKSFLTGKMKLECFSSEVNKILYDLLKLTEDEIHYVENFYPPLLS